MTNRQFVVRNQQGSALFAALLLLILMLTLGMASQVYSTLDLKSTTHYNTGNQAFFAAEAGIIHSLSNINQIGVLDFQNDIAERWGSVFGPAAKTSPEHPKAGYQVVVIADPADPVNRGTLMAVGFAPSQARRLLRVTLDKGGFEGSPGAIYLAADAISSAFDGNAFEIDGNNHDMFGGLAAGDSKAGIATRNDSVTDTVVGSLTDPQKDNIRGQEFSLDPLTPSVLTTGGPGVGDLDVMVNNILANPAVVTTDDGIFNGVDVFGTLDAPQITYMTNAHVRMNGNASGAGILIVDDAITINGTLDFVGWIIVRGDTVISARKNDDDTVVLGDATILGALWTGNLEIEVGGSAIIDYCKTCLELADGVAPPDHLIPRPMKVVSWQEVL